MDGFVCVGKAADFAPNRLSAVDVGGPPVAVVNLNGELHAFSDFCPHEGVPLSPGYGTVNGRSIICMMHSSMFDVGTGAVILGEAETGLLKYDVLTEGDDVYVCVYPTN